MEAKELRIGNLVIDNFNGKFGYVENIGKKIVTIVLNSENLKCDYDSISPILITKEWLINFGFKYSSRYEEYILKDIQISFFKNDVYISVDCGTDPPESNSVTFYYLKHVHELQNLFYLKYKEELCLDA